MKENGAPDTTSQGTARNREPRVRRGSFRAGREGDHRPCPGGQRAAPGRRALHGSSEPSGGLAAWAHP
ncbi:MAG: hypothetical protein E6K73_14090 [Candidatus Eisenbacteria bacterium]|uniref:Uncharacterized protein n=1 Tax=Eiseniibacteriota bacterium TaxID=2212470 RepID=A0A538S6Z7_UNCEI|nr:MAG: hypothetical protein E6K73_14090 [Candidatus Eisenbacteria bacterium]